MKSVKLVIIILIFFPLNLFAMVCLDIDPGDCSWGQCSEYYRDAILLTAVSAACNSQACNDAIASAKSIELNKSKYVGGNCSIKRWYVPSGCAVVHTHVLCDSAWIANQNDTESISSASLTITGVAVGGEKEASDIALELFQLDSASCQDRGPDFLHSDTVYGVSYTSYLTDQNNVNVDTTSWRRCGYARSGTGAVPLDNLTAPGGGGLSFEDMSSAVGAGVAGLDDKLVGSNNFLNNIDLGIQGLSSGSYMSGSGGGAVPYDVSNVDNKTYSSVWNSFVTGIKTTDLYTLGSGFFDGVPQQGTIAAPSFVVDGGDTFGTHEFQFSWFDSLLAVLKPCVILAFSFISVRLVMIKGGSG